MSRKSKQHIVPQTYLRSFTDSRVPDGWQGGKPFTPYLWVHPRTLDSPPTRSAPRNVAGDRDVYTLRDDDPEHPWLEEVLGRLESSFGSTIERVRSGGELLVDDRAVLSLFVGALHERTVGILKQRQAFFDDLANMTRQFEDDQSVDPSTAAARARFWNRFSEEAKRQVANSAEAFATVTGPHSLLIENTSSMPFITSDSPTTYRQIHADELLGMGVPEEWMYRKIPRSAREFFVFCPLSPRHAFIASRFFPPHGTMRRRSLSTKKPVFHLNEFTRESAKVDLYSSSEAPYGPLLPVALSRDRIVNAARENPPSFLNVHSQRDRYALPIVGVRHGQGDHPLTGRLTFVTTELTMLRAMASDNDFAEILIIENGRETGGMRGAWFVSVALDPEAQSVIENGPIRP